MFRRLLVICALGLLLPASAHAATFPGERVAANPMLNDFVAIGERFWQARGAQPCPADRLTVYLADDLGPGVDGRATIGGCEAWFPAAAVAVAQSTPRMPQFARDLCSHVVHEIGHTAGLEHSSDGGMMDPNRDMAVVPSECRDWAATRASSKRCRRTLGTASRRQHQTQRSRSRLARKRQRAASRRYRRAVLRSESRALRHAKRAR
jgi:hypothetical protein